VADPEHFMGGGNLANSVAGTLAFSCCRFINIVETSDRFFFHSQYLLFFSLKKATDIVFH